MIHLMKSRTSTGHSTSFVFSSPSFLFHGILAFLLFKSQAEGRLMARKRIPMIRKAQGTPWDLTSADRITAKSAPPTPAPA